jgi:hypothetical protein
LSLPEARIISPQTPSTAFVTPNKIKIRIPMSFQFSEIDIQKDIQEKYTVPIRPFIRTEKPEKAEKPEISPSEKAASALIMTVQVLSEKNIPQKESVGEIDIEFLMSAK